MKKFVRYWLLAIANLAVLTAAEKAKPCNTNCGCAARLRRRLALLKNDLDDAKTATQNNERDMLKLIVAAIATDDQTRASIAPVLAAAGKIVQNCKDRLTDADAKYAQALARTEQLATIYSVQSRLQSSDRQLQINLANNARLTGTNYALAHTLAALGADNCKNTTEDDSDKGTITETGDDAESAPNKLINHVNLLGKCRGDGTDTNSCHGTALTNDGKIHVKLEYAADSKQAGDWPDMNAAHAPVGTQAFDLIGDKASETHYDLKELAKILANMECKQSIRSYSTITSQQLYKLLLTKTTPGKEDAESGDELTGQELKTVTATRYGDDGKNFKANLWDTIDNNPAYLGKQKTEDTTQVKKLETLDKIGEASARALVKQLKNKATSKTEKTAKETEKATEDKKGGDNTAKPV
ncbi:uncharacterized protein TEOVI_000108400 [Trypanosoma equiperdum]|uniref:Uncharacterized protein n=1 Tax=Trypanosoma equiperdum TaxID=5694 RepID=A0A1G4IB95_TRYEQ|nr:hypothetical protein, conserved [Trypanosoma equiperdum]